MISRKQLPRFINGRPRQYQPVGYSAHAPITKITDVQAAQLFGLVLAVRFQNYSDRPFVGTIINARPVGTSSANTVMMYMASFNDQLGDCPDSCELTQNEIMSSHRLYISYNKEAKKRGKLVVLRKTDFLNCIFNILYVIIYYFYP